MNKILSLFFILPVIIFMFVSSCQVEPVPVSGSFIYDGNTYNICSGELRSIGEYYDTYRFDFYGMSDIESNGIFFQLFSPIPFISFGPHLESGTYYYNTSYPPGGYTFHCWIYINVGSDLWMGIDGDAANDGTVNVTLDEDILTRDILTVEFAITLTNGKTATGICSGVPIIKDYTQDDTQDDTQFGCSSY